MCGLLGEVAFVAEPVGADDGWWTWCLFIVGNAHIIVALLVVALTMAAVGLLVQLVSVWRPADAKPA